MNTQKTQTAVEWLAEELNHCLENNGMIKITPNLLIKLKEQAKAMEKEQMIQFYSHGWHDGQDVIIAQVKHINKGGDDAGEQYYNQTYQTQP